MNHPFEIYDRFLAETGPDRLQKILARYELFKMSMNVPGDIVECGVFRGAGIYTWVKLMRLFKPNTEAKVIGFDFFGADRGVTLKHAEDKQCLDAHETNWTPADSLIANCRQWGFQRLELIPGNVVETTRNFAEKTLGARISLLYLDVDNYEGTRAALENLYPLVSVGGIVALDEYGLRGYGESNAVDEFFAGKGVEVRTLPWANTPSGYIVKQSR